MTEYAFASTWDLEAPIDRVWAVVEDSEHWSEWFPGLRKVTTVDPGGPDGVGRELEATVRATLPYDLTFRARVTRLEAPHLLEIASVGDLQGSGRWTLAEEGGITTSRFEWRVATTKPWMNALAPVAKPLFAWNHDLAMTAAGRGLAEHLGVRLLANESGPVEPDRSTLAAAAVVGALVLTAAAVAVGRRRAGRV
jgi:uncharacterized protein YndB with AHSA1/START domain